MITKKNKAVFIDRDGTLIVEKHYLKDPDDVFLIDGTVEALDIFRELGFLIIVVSNQSGVARGILTEDDVRAVNIRIEKILSDKGHSIDGFYYCPHYALSDDATYGIECNCRKPATGMIDKAVKEFNIDTVASFVIGDKMSDIKLAHNAQCQPVLVRTGYGLKTIMENKEMEDQLIFDDLKSFALYLKNNVIK